MGFLDNSSITVDAILTTYATRKIADGAPLGIKYFGLSDDGIDYKMWNEGHTGGSDKYGDALENLPMLEASTAMHLNMRYRLGPGNINNLVNPYIILDYSVYELRYANRETGSELISPVTANWSSKEEYNWTIIGEEAIQYVPGGTQLEPRLDQAFLPEGSKNNIVVINGSNTLEVWASPVNTKQFVTIRVEGAVTGCIATVRIVVDKNIFV